MANRIEDYALLSDTQSAALVGRDGSIDWLTFPRFDSAACFAALLGGRENGHWRIAPVEEVLSVSRRYRPGSLVLETRFTTAAGEVEIIDCMPIRADDRLDVVRLVRGISGRVPMRMHLTVRMDYGSIVPWVHHVDGVLRMVAGPDSLTFSSPVELQNHDFATVAEFSVSRGDELPFDLAWRPSHQEPPKPTSVFTAISSTTAWWQRWIRQAADFGAFDEPIRSSLTVLKGLTYAPTGGIVAAATTSLPESIGGPRNWDYRYCWLRDATFTLTSLIDAGFTKEATAWRDWLLRAVAGKPDQVQIMYGPAGERRLTEMELPWLSGYEGSLPVRIGNGAHDQFQLDVFGEVLDTFLAAHPFMEDDQPDVWRMGRALVEVVDRRWREPDDGIWEVRGGRRHFTHSKVMAWVAMDRAIRLSESDGAPSATVDRWKATREAIRAEVLDKGVDADGVFVQSFGSTALDASLLLVPLVGFLPADDPRVVATVNAIQERLSHDGFVYRYDSSVTDDGVGGHEGTFLMCTFWLADVLLLQGRVKEAREIYDRLVGLRNDVGLLAEMYDPVEGRMLGNFPQAFSHTALVSTGIALSCRQRADEEFWHRG
ncbi:MAG: glycoside hydrolase family 15 protein [Acidimicrobiales bacterium]|nr:glycoside hydrolase family 15 protein [Acidimicrobiales bacterium]